MDMPDTNNSTSTTKTVVQWAANLVPIITWLPHYQSGWLWSDLIAGLTLAAYAIPVAMAYSALAGLPSQTGLYCYIFCGIVYALFTSSRHLAIGPTAAISVMVASVVGEMAGGDVAVYAAIAALTAGVVAMICVLAWCLRLSAFVNFISETVLIGFKAGAAISIASTQLPKLFGLAGGGDHFAQRIMILCSQLGGTNPVVLMLSVSAIILLVLGEKLFRRRPVALVVVALSTAAVSLFDLAGQGVTVVGLIPSGLPAFAVPVIGMHQVESVLELAFACFLLSYVESIAAARTFAERHAYSVDPRQELLALGAANLAAALGQGYPVGGGLSQSAVNEKSGARTPLSLVFASLTLTLALFFLTGLLRNLPDAVLAAVVVVAVAGFVNIADFKRLWHISRLEFYVALVAFVAVLLVGILKGVMISAVVSILFLLRLLSKPHVAVLGRIPGTIRFSDAARHTSNERFPGLLLFRVEAPLLYFNVDNIFATVIGYVHTQSPLVRMVVCDLSTSPYIDASGARMLAKLEEQLGKWGIQFRVAEAHSEVREILRASGFSESLGGVSRYIALADIVEDFERDEKRRAARLEAPSDKSDQSEKTVPH
jgi:sulfate permease, SulP family